MRTRRWGLAPLTTLLAFSGCSDVTVPTSDDRTLPGEVARWAVEDRRVASLAVDPSGRLCAVLDVDEFRTAPDRPVTYGCFDAEGTFSPLAELGRDGTTTSLHIDAEGQAGAILSSDRPFVAAGLAGEAFGECWVGERDDARTLEAACLPADVELAAVHTDRTTAAIQVRDDVTWQGLALTAGTTVVVDDLTGTPRAISDLAFDSDGPSFLLAGRDAGTLLLAGTAVGIPSWATTAGTAEDVEEHAFFLATSASLAFDVGWLDVVRTHVDAATRSTDDALVAVVTHGDERLDARWHDLVTFAAGAVLDVPTRVVLGTGGAVRALAATRSHVALVVALSDPFTPTDAPALEGADGEVALAFFDRDGTFVRAFVTAHSLGDLVGLPDGRFALAIDGGVVLVTP